MRALIGNPLLVWGLRHARREKRVMVAVVVFLLIFYGVVFLTITGWLGVRGGGGPRWRDLLTVLHFEAWAANGLLLLVWAPSRLAQRLAKDKEQGTLDILRLTGMSGMELAVGTAATASSLPLLMAVLTLPIILAGMGGTGGPVLVLEAYLSLLTLAPVYILLGGLVGLAVKKSNQAGSATMFCSLTLLAISGGGSTGDFSPLSLMGPWGAGLSGVEPGVGPWRIPLFGHPVSGSVLQTVFLLLLAWALLSGLGRRFAGEPAAFLGRTGALVLACAVATVAGVTFYPSIDRKGLFGVTNAASLTIRMGFTLVALLILAAETPVRWRDLVRGLARREPDDLVQPEERLDVPRFLPIPLVVAGLAIVLGTVILHALSGADWDSDRLGIDLAGALVGATILALAAVFGALVYQAILLYTHDRRSPRLLGTIGLVVLWMAPLLAYTVLRELGAPKPFGQLALSVNPFVGIANACYHLDPGFSSGGLHPFGLAVTTAALHFFGVLGMLTLVRSLYERSREHAATLVALPSDAFGAPGSLTQQCSEGHRFSRTWAACPHCVKAPG